MLILAIIMYIYAGLTIAMLDAKHNRESGTEAVKAAVFTMILWPIVLFVLLLE